MQLEIQAIGLHQYLLRQHAFWNAVSGYEHLKEIATHKGPHNVI